MYGYADGDPINKSDPFGLMPAVCVLAPGGCVAIGAAVGRLALRVFASVLAGALFNEASERDREVEGALGGLEGEGEVSKTRSGARHVDRRGDGASAGDALRELAERLGRPVVPSADGDVSVVRIPGGGTASARPKSGPSGDGPPTIQVNRPGSPTTKIRFDNPE